MTGRPLTLIAPHGTLIEGTYNPDTDEWAPAAGLGLTFTLSRMLESGWRRT